MRTRRRTACGRWRVLGPAILFALGSDSGFAQEADPSMRVVAVRAGRWYKLQVGDFHTADRARERLREFRAAGYADAWVVAESRPDATRGPIYRIQLLAVTDSLALAAPRREFEDRYRDQLKTRVLVSEQRPPSRTAVDTSRAIRPPTPAWPTGGQSEPESVVDLVDPVTPNVTDEASRRRSPSSVRLLVSLASRFETNIDHDQDELQTWGIVAGARLAYRFEGDATEVELGYEVARHEYRDAPRWSRIGQTAQAELEQDLGGPWKLDLLAEASLGGSTEDRELADVYSFRPRLEFKIDRASRLRLKTALRFKRFEGEPDRNATAPYVGLEFRRRIGPTATWSVATRYELKDTPSERRRYHRWTHEVDLRLPTGRGQLELGLKYRVKNYTSRLVELDGGAEALRRDRRIKPSLSWSQPIGSLMGLRLAYEYESRSSNDPDKEYDAHAFGLTLWSLVP